MALTVTERGTGGNNTGATTLVVVPASTLAAGSLGVLCVAVDNQGAAGAVVISPASVTDSVSNVWTRRINPLFDNGSAGAGVETVCYTALLTTPLTSSNNITITWVAPTVSPVAKAWALKEVVSGISGNTPTYATGAAGTGATSGTPTVTTSSIPAGDVVIGWGGAESADTWAGDADTSNGSWSTHVHAGFGLSTTGMSITAQHKITTGTATQTYNPTLTSCDRILGWISVHEVPKAASGSGSLATSASFAQSGAKAGAGAGGTLTDAAALTAAGTRGGRGTATLSDSPILASAGKKGGAGAATLSDPASLDATDAKQGQGAGALPAAAILTAAATKQAAGVGALPLTASLAAAGEQKGEGVGSLALVASMAAAGAKGASGIAALSEPATLSAAGRKAAAGTGALSDPANLAATGTASGAAAGASAHMLDGGAPAPRFHDVWIEVLRKHASGHGRMALVPTMAASGSGDHSEDELAELLALGLLDNDWLAAA